MLACVLENPNYIINIANAARNVNGLGVDMLLVVDGLKRLDDDPELIKNRKSLLKHSSGAIRFIDVRRFDTSDACLDFLEQNGFNNIGTSPDHQKSELLHESDLTAPKLAIWFGDEANGLSETVLNRCASCVSIPMKGQVESFNLGTSTGIVLWEAVRQRIRAI